MDMKLCSKCVGKQPVRGEGDDLAEGADRIFPNDVGSLFGQNGLGVKETTEKVQHGVRMPVNVEPLSVETVVRPLSTPTAQFSMPYEDNRELLSREREHYAEVLASLMEKERRYEVLLAQSQQDHQDTDQIIARKVADALALSEANREQGRRIEESNKKGKAHKKLLRQQTEAASSAKRDFMSATLSSVPENYEASDLPQADKSLQSRREPADRDRGAPPPGGPPDDAEQRGDGKKEKPKKKTGRQPSGPPDDDPDDSPDDDDGSSSDEEEDEEDDKKIAGSKER